MNPLKAFFCTIRYLFGGRLHFPRDRVGEILTLEDGHRWRIFRQVMIEPTAWANPGAVFRAKFHLAQMNPRANIWFSLLPIPFFVGLPGFRSKIWLYCEETGDFQGIYEWDSVEAAKNYQNSFAGKFMVRRSIPESVSFQILDAAAPVRTKPGSSIP